MPSPHLGGTLRHATHSAPPTPAPKPSKPVRFRCEHCGAEQQSVRVHLMHRKSRCPRLYSKQNNSDR